MRCAISLACVAMLLALGGSAFAQSGSTGGSLGKKGKSASGGEMRAPAPKEKRKTAALVSISGRWHWEADCDVGGPGYKGAFEFEQSPDGTLKGMCSGGADCGPISGQIAGNKATFSIDYTFSLNYHRNLARFTVADGGKSMHGTEETQGHGTCRYQARKD